MKRAVAIALAQEFVDKHKLDVGRIVNVRYCSTDDLDRMAADCPPDLVATHESVRKRFRNSWVVQFEVNCEEGSVCSPSSRLICVFEDNNEVAEYQGM